MRPRYVPWPPFLIMRMLVTMPRANVAWPPRFHKAQLDSRRYPPFCDFFSEWRYAGWKTGLLRSKYKSEVL